MRRAVMQHARHVLMGQHGLDAGIGERLADVDALDAGMGDGGALDLAVQHAGQLDVAGIFGLARHLLQHVLALDALADDLEIALFLEVALFDRACHVHDLAASISSAADLIASKIFV